MKKQSTKIKHPEWALKFKKKGTELRLINGTYYLYEVTSKWNPQKKRSQKITGKFLGKITPEGFIESEKNKLKEGFEQSLKTPLQVKEYGASHFIMEYFKQYNDNLKEHFSDLWQDIIALAFVQLAYQAPVKNVGFYFKRSHLSEIFSDITMGEKRVGALYRKIGSYRSKVAGFMKQSIEEKDNILIDATHLISYSRHIDIAKYGYNSAMQYDPQVNLMFLFAIININLALINFLPLLPLDGGLVLMFIIEWIRGKMVPLKIQEGLMQFGWMLLIFLLVFVTYKDIVRFFMKG